MGLCHSKKSRRQQYQQGDMTRIEQPILIINRKSHEVEEQHKPQIFVQNQQNLNHQEKSIDILNLTTNQANSTLLYESNMSKHNKENQQNKDLGNLKPCDTKKLSEIMQNLPKSNQKQSSGKSEGRFKIESQFINDSKRNLFDEEDKANQHMQFIIQSVDHVVYQKLEIGIPVKQHDHYVVQTWGCYDSSLNQK